MRRNSSPLISHLYLFVT
uniref:Uncharacterized protein n=1 Tax=Arundo donax TaxID=35708 RepID=A0A0A8YAW4_ARUDO